MKSNKCFFMILVGLWALFLGNKPAFCTTYYVPDDYPTIQAAVNATWGGDTVIVRAGTYTGEGNRNITINKIITVKSETGPENTVIDCEGAGRGFTITNVSNLTVLDGFKIINGSVTGTNCGGGIYCSSASPKISNCIINGNSAYNGGGVCSSAGGSPSFSNCIINNNNAVTYGGGIYSDASGYPSFTNCAISTNSASWGGGMCAFNSNNPTFTNCTFAWNSATHGGGICSWNSVSTIRNSIFYFDSALQEIYKTGGTITITYSNIMGGYTGEGNITVNPEFVTGGDFHLSASSPCIDTASPANAPATDIDNELRPHGAGYDMGADEFDGIPAPPPSKADLNEDGVVDGLDVSLFATEFGKIY